MQSLHNITHPLDSLVAQVGLGHGELPTGHASLAPPLQVCSPHNTPLSIYHNTPPLALLHIMRHPRAFNSDTLFNTLS